MAGKRSYEVESDDDGVVYAYEVVDKITGKPRIATREEGREIARQLAKERGQQLPGNQ